MVRARTIYLLYANRQGGFEILRRRIRENNAHPVHSFPDSRSVLHWLNSTPAIFLETSEWRVIADYADPISGSITIPKLGRADSHRFLIQRLGNLAASCSTPILWQYSTPIPSSQPMTEPMATPLRQIRRWQYRWQAVLSKLHQYRHIPRQWVVHAFPDSPTGQALHQIMCSLAKYPKTHMTGPFSMTHLLAHMNNKSSVSPTRFRVCKPPLEQSDLVSLQTGGTVLFSRLMPQVVDGNPQSPAQHLARLLPTLYAHQLLNRQSRLPDIECLAPEIYPHGVLRWLAQAQAIDPHKLSVFRSPSQANPSTLTSRLRTQLGAYRSKRFFQFGWLGSISLLIGWAISTSVFPPSHTPQPAYLPTLENLIPTASAQTDETLLDENLPPAAPLLDTLSSPPKIQETQALSTKTPTMADYGWIRRSDGMVLRWKGETKPLDHPDSAEYAGPSWTLRRAQPQP